MRLADVMGLLVGRRDSILRVARSPHAIWVGSLFVASAAMAREYDRHWLVADWWHLLLPFGASVAMAFVQFSLFWLRRDHDQSGATFGQSFRAFLACFWMTAPLAWAYAIPYEQFLSPADAVAANLWTLGIVSLLRGIIICHVLRVIANVAYWRALLISAAPAQVIVSSLILFTPVPLLDVMGGIRYTPEELVIRNALGLIVLETIFAGWIIVIIGLGIVATTRAVFRREDVSAGSRASTISFALPIVVSIAFIACLPWTQPPWQRAYRADQLVRQGDLAGALRFMSEHPRQAFPIDWRPLPKTSLYFEHPNLLDILEQIESIPTDAWPRRYYLSELERAYLSSQNGYFPDDLILAVDDLLARLPEGEALRRKYDEKLRDIRERHAIDHPATTQATQPSTP